MAARTASGRRADVESGDVDLPSIGFQQCRQDLDGGRLARAVGPEQAEDRPFFDVEIDTVEDDSVAERLA